MGVKYTIPFKSNDNVSWRVDIATDPYTALPISIRGVSEQVALLAYESDTDDPYTTLVKSTLTINIYDQSQVDVAELRKAQDRDFTVTVYRENVLDWTGYLVADGIQQPLISTPYPLSIIAICGLSMLDDMDYVHNDLPGLDAEPSRCPMNYFRNILFTNLGISLPIRWTNTLICTGFDGLDVFTAGVQWAANNEGFYSYQSGQDGSDQGSIRSCGYILAGILQAMQCRIYQCKGKWRIRRVNDFATGVISYREIAATLGTMTVLSATEDIRDHIGASGYPMVNEEAVLTTKQGIKTVRVTYNANVRENILPNGNQDEIVAPVIGMKPLVWGQATGSVILVTSGDSLDGRTGYATELDSTIGTNYYTMVAKSSVLYSDGLPIDTKVLITRINFGFQFSPINFPTTGTPDNIIDWTTNPLQVQVALNLFGTRYRLNDFGYWQTDEATISIVVDGMRLDDVSQVNFDKFQGIIMPEPTNRPQAGDESDLQVVFLVKSGTSYVVDNISVTIDSGNDVYESTYDASRNTTVVEPELNISSAYPGYMLSNFMSSPFASDTECFFRDAAIYTGTLTGLCANAMMRFMYKASDIFNGSIRTTGKNWDFDTLWTIDSLGAARFLPLNATYNIEKCQTSIVAIECRNDNVIFTEKYYNSNDLPGSD